MTFEEHVIQMVNSIRADFVEQNSARMYIAVEVEGNAHNDLKITYKVGTSEYGTVKSFNLESAKDEFFRQQGWKSQHNPVLISYTGEEKEEV